MMDMYFMMEKPIIVLMNAYISISLKRNIFELLIVMMPIGQSGSNNGLLYPLTIQVQR